MKVTANKIVKKREYQYRDIMVSGLKGWEINHKWCNGVTIPDAVSSAEMGTVCFTIRKPILTYEE